MKIINTQQIQYWPDHVMLGYAKIQDKRSDDLLSDTEVESYKAFQHNRRKAEFLTGRHLFRFLISHSDINYANVELLKQQQGKPYFKYEDKLAFVSFSHTKSLVFCAISLSLDIGLDAESCERKVSQRVIDRILNEEELSQLSQIDPVKLWTIKEAAVKTLGTGLRTNLNEVKIDKKKGNQYLVRFNDEYIFEICSFRIQNHQIALAYQSQ
jgi:phosphopantetheinyl transferase